VQLNGIEKRRFRMLPDTEEIVAMAMRALRCITRSIRSDDRQNGAMRHATSYQPCLPHQYTEFSPKPTPQGSLQGYRPVAANAFFMDQYDRFCIVSPLDVEVFVQQAAPSST
jgi:hypothetical protein